MTRLGALVDRAAGVRRRRTRRCATRPRAMTDAHADRRARRGAATASAIVTDADLRERVLAAGPLARRPGAPSPCAAGATRARRPHGRRGARRPARRRRARAVRDRARRAHRRPARASRTSPAASTRRSRCAARSRAPPDEDALVATLCRPGCRGCSPRCCRPGWRPRTSRARCRPERHRDAAADRLRLRRATARRRCAWAWLALGSVARRELTLASDQDNALAYAEGRRRGRRVLRARGGATSTPGSRACGFGEDHAEVLARDPRWRMSAERVARGVRGLPRAPRPLAPRARGGEPSTSATSAAASRSSRRSPRSCATRATTPDFVAPPRADRDRLEGRRSAAAGGVAHRPRRARRPEARRRAADRQPRALPRAAAGITISGTLDRLVAARGDRPARRARPRPRCARRSRSSRGSASSTTPRASRDGRPADNRVDPAGAAAAAARRAARGAAGGRRRAAPPRRVRAAGHVTAPRPVRVPAGLAGGGRSPAGRSGWRGCRGSWPSAAQRWEPRARRAVASRRRSRSSRRSRAPTARRAVLKVNFPEPESEHEAAALAHWDGAGAVRLLASDPGRRALLRRALRAGRSAVERRRRGAGRPCRPPPCSVASGPRRRRGGPPVPHARGRGAALGGRAARPLASATGAPSTARCSTAPSAGSASCSRPARRAARGPPPPGPPRRQRPARARAGPGSRSTPSRSPASAPSTSPRCCATAARSSLRDPHPARADPPPRRPPERGPRPRPRAHAAVGGRPRARVGPGGRRVVRATSSRAPSGSPRA